MSAIVAFMNIDTNIELEQRPLDIFIECEKIAVAYSSAIYDDREIIGYSSSTAASWSAAGITL